MALTPKRRHLSPFEGQVLGHFLLSTSGNFLLSPVVFVAPFLGAKLPLCIV